MPPHSSAPPSGITTIIPKTNITGTPQTASIAIPIHNFYEIIALIGIRDQTQAATFSTSVVNPRKSGASQAGRIIIINDGAATSVDLPAFNGVIVTGNTEAAGKTGFYIAHFYEQNTNVNPKFFEGSFGGYTFKGDIFSGMIEDSNPMDEIFIDLAGTNLIDAISWYKILGRS